MKLNKCPACKTYTIKETCSKCKNQTKSAHYKFKQIRDAPKDSSEYFMKKRKKKDI